MRWGGWGSEAGWNCGWRIVALLFGLAQCADRAAGLRGARRDEVLAILLRAEAVAYGFIVGMAAGGAGDFSRLPDRQRVAAAGSRPGQGPRRPDEAAASLTDGQVEGIAHDTASPVEGLPPAAGMPGFSGDAKTLAARLLVLALVLWFMLAQEPVAESAGHAHCPVGRPRHAGLAATACRRAAPSPPDTS